MCIVRGARDKNVKLNLISLHTSITEAVGKQANSFCVQR